MPGKLSPFIQLANEEAKVNNIRSHLGNGITFEQSTYIFLKYQLNVLFFYNFPHL